MNISNNTSDLKMYSRNKYSDGLPYTSEDIHQERDLMLRKLGLIMDSLMGSGLLEKPSFSVVSNGANRTVRISNPVPVNLNGDIFLIGNSSNSYPLSIPSSANGSIVLVCWYTNVASSSTLYEYGGLCNNTMTNDLTNSTLSIQTSSRIQVRWNLGYCSTSFDYANPSTSNITLQNTLTTETGSHSNITFSNSNMTINGKFYKVPSTSKFSSYDGNVYILPLGSITNSSITPYDIQTMLASIVTSSTPSQNYHKVWYNPTTEEVKMYFNGSWRSVGGSTIIKSATEPSSNIKEGDIWYNSTLGEFKIYISGIGFVDTYAKMGFVQLQATHEFISATNNPQNITISIPIDTYISSDLLRVSYEGIELTKGTNYDLNTANKTITLKNFTTSVGDKILFIVTRLVGSSDLVTTLSMLEDHINDTGNSSAFGHLKLTDTPSLVLGVSSGLAATPKSVKEVENKINSYTDVTTGTAYELGINNGLLFIREKV